MKAVPFIPSRSRNNGFTTCWLAVSATLLCIASIVQAEVPNAIAHQGRIAVTGVNFEGNGQFKFLLFADADADHASGNETPLWSNASTSPAAMSEPASAVTVSVTKGLYGTWLGDTTIPNMAALPASVEPPAGTRLYLRVWFGDGIAPFVELAPDQAIAAVPFALSAASVTQGGVTANALADGAVTAAKIAPGAFTDAVIEDGSITSEKLAPGAVTQLGTPGQPGSIGPGSMIVTLGSSSDSLTDGADVAVQGDYAYVVDAVAGKLQIFDVSNPNHIIAYDSEQTGLSTPKSVAVQGDFAYVVDTTTNRLQVFDVSNPISIVARGSHQGGLAAPRFVEVEDDFAYVGDSITRKIHIFNISNPDSLVQHGVSPAILSGTLRGIGVSDGLGFILEGPISVPGGKLHALNVSNPDSVVLIGSGDVTDIANSSDVVNSMKVQGRKVYVTGILNPAIWLFDFAQNPTFVPGPKRLSVDSRNSNPASVDADGDVVVYFGSEGLSLSNSSGFFFTSFEGDRGDFQISTLASDTAITVENGYVYAVNGSILQIFQIAPLTASTSLGVNGQMKVRGTIQSESIEAPLIQADSFVSDNFSFSTPKSFALSIPGNAMLAQSPPDAFFRSTIGFIRPSEVSTSFSGVAPVQLPQGATITGMDIIYYDDSVGNSFTNLTTRLRRLDMFSTSGSPEQNIIALDVPSPSSPNSTTLVSAINNSPDASRNVVDNTNYQYFVTVGATVTAPDADLRFYGFRIRYTLTTLSP